MDAENVDDWTKDRRTKLNDAAKALLEKVRELTKRSWITKQEFSEFYRHIDDAEAHLLAYLYKNERN